MNNKMRIKPFLAIVFVFFIFNVSAGAQTHVSVPLESHVYYVLEQAELRGLCSPLSGVRPYTRNVIIKAINEILAPQNESKLNETEREILEQFIEKYETPQSALNLKQDTYDLYDDLVRIAQQQGLNLKQGTYGGKTVIGKNDTFISANIGASMDIEWSSGLYSSERYYGWEMWLRIFMNGDLGSHLSWEANGEAGYFKSPRKQLGIYYPYYEGFVESDKEKEIINKPFNVYSQPLSYFPYTYQKRWDGSIHYLTKLIDFDSWPDSPAVGYNIKSEISSSFFEDKLIMRIGRLTHEWGASPLGSSLALNKMARPFLGLEAEFSPVSWVSLATMTGFLEFFNIEGEKISGMTFQNAYSITMLQFKYKNYLFMNIGETVIWPKRFEFGYIFPLIPSIVYKGNMGDFDNLGALVNLKAQYPGIGNIWFSLFWDEALLRKDMGVLDRTMIAYQTGINFSLPVLPFSSFKVSYTKVNPYCYTHIRVAEPYYGGIRMEEAYVNNGVSLGYYIPPNSDELLFSLKTMPKKNISMSLQYQLIRHGADYGSSAVDGSSLRSELDPDGRDGTNTILKKFFLKDGAYQWMHIIKAGAEWSLPSQPITFFGEAGINHSYFTNTEEKANSGAAYPYSRIDTEEYPKSTGFMVKLGVRIFPR